MVYMEQGRGENGDSKAPVEGKHLHGSSEQSAINRLYFLFEKEGRESLDIPSLIPHRDLACHPCRCRPAPR